MVRLEPSRLEPMRREAVSRVYGVTSSSSSSGVVVNVNINGTNCPARSYLQLGVTCS